MSFYSVTKCNILSLPNIIHQFTLEQLQDLLGQRENAPSRQPTLPQKRKEKNHFHLVEYANEVAVV